jgi:hypothetical protein
MRSTSGDRRIVVAGHELGDGVSQFLRECGAIGRRAEANLRIT